MQELLGRAVELGRGARGEFEGVVFDLDLAVEAFDRRLKPALADEAPPALHVRPDVDLGGFAHVVDPPGRQGYDP
jgi:hypothetical protein